MALQLLGVRTRIQSAANGQQRCTPLHIPYCMPEAFDHGWGDRQGMTSTSCCCRARAAGVLTTCTPNVHCPAGPVATVTQEVRPRVCIARAYASVTSTESARQTRTEMPYIIPQAK
jgi:hypothetical protein